MRWIALIWVCAAVAAADVSYTITTVAGGTFCGDGWNAASSYLGAPESLVADPAGNIYISDSQDHRIRRIAVSGVISTVAGDGHPGFRGDGGSAGGAQLNMPYGLALDNAGNLYIADLGNARIRMVGTDGRIRTVAGGGNGPTDALRARLNEPRNLAVDGKGNLYIADFGDHVIYRVTSAGRIDRVAGTGEPGRILDGEIVLAEFAPLNAPAGLALDRNGALYIADSGNGRIRKLERGLLATVPAGDVELGLPTGIAFGAGGALYVADKSRSAVLQIAPQPFPVAGDGTPGYGGDGGPAAVAQLSAPRDLAFDLAGNLLIADSAGGGGFPAGMVRKVTPDGLIYTLAGGNGFRPRGDLGPATWAHLEAPSSVAVSRDGVLYIADRADGAIRKVDGDLIMTAGGGVESGSLDQPAGLALDSAGNLFIAEAGASRVLEWQPGGPVTTVAGVGEAGFSGDRGAAVNARLNHPEGIAIDAAGVLYVADTLNSVVRAVSAGVIQSFAGTGVQGNSGDGGSANSALLARPAGVAAGRNGEVYVADTANGAIRQVAPSGRISTVASLLRSPAAIAADSKGNLFVADAGSHTVLRVASDGSVEAIAGTGSAGFGGDDGPATVAELNSPRGIAVDEDGNIYVADTGNGRVRKLTPFVPPVEPPAVQVANIVNAASLLSGPVAPGELVAIFGAGLGPDEAAGASLDAGGRVGAEVAGVQVLFDGVPAPLLYVQSSQINAQVPYEVAGREQTQVEVRRRGEVKARYIAPVADAAPAFFTTGTGTGSAAAVNEAGVFNSAEHPARRGSIVVLYATGEGLTNPPSVTGGLAEPPYPRPTGPVRVRIGGSNAEILYAGSAPGFAGLMQLNVRIPEAIPAGFQSVDLRVGTAESPAGVTVAIQ